MTVGKFEHATVEFRDGLDETQAKTHTGGAPARVTAVEALDDLAPFGSGDTETQSVSHNIDISFTSARVNVMVVSACNRMAPRKIPSAEITPKTSCRRIEWGPQPIRLSAYHVKRGDPGRFRGQLWPLPGQTSKIMIVVTMMAWIKMRMTIHIRRLAEAGVSPGSPEGQKNFTRLRNM